MKNGFDISVDNISVNCFCGANCRESLNGDHCHDHFEITYLICGEGRYIVEGSEHKVGRGTLLLIDPMAYHKVEMNFEGEIEGYSIHFSRSVLPESVASMLDGITCGDGDNGRIFGPQYISEELANCFERFGVTNKLNDTESRAYIHALLSEIVILLSASEGERMARDGDELGARVARYINLNIEKNVKLDKLAKHFFISKYHLCRAFKSYSGTSVHAYVNQKRIIYAKGLIESGMTASGAAERVGFGDYSAFYRSYVRIVGKSPTAK